MERKASGAEQGLTHADLGLKPTTVISERPVERERMSDDELGNLVSAVGNHEAKALILLAMQEGITYTARDLHQEIIRRQGKGGGGWKLSYRRAFDYCKDSLEPIGLVVSEVIHPANPGLPYGYKKEYGQGVGDTFAAALLKFSYEHPDFSLIDLFGRTNSSSSAISTTEEGIEVKKRAPITRLKIFWELATSELPIRENDLEERTGESLSSINTHLRSLADHGIINYESVEKGKPFSFYQLSVDAPEEPPPPGGGYVSLTDFVYSSMTEQPSTKWTADALADSYLINLMAQGNKEVKRANLRSNISRILIHLLKGGYATRGKFSKRRQTDITLTPEQERVISDLVTLVDGLQNNDPNVIREAEDFKGFLFSHPDAVAVLLRKVKDHSTLANSRPIEDTMADVMGVLAQSQDPFTNEQIRQALHGIQGRKLSIFPIQAITSDLAKQGRLFVASRDKGVKRYTTKPPVPTS